MTAFFDYPKSAAFGRVVPKTKIYEHAGANTALKDLFVREVDQIVWRFKLAPETINLSATKSVTEIQVFSISLKTGKLDEGVLRAIDKAIPFPLIFDLTYGGKRKAMAAFKRPSEADSMKWVISEYFATDWAPEDTARAPLPVALNLGALYEGILGAILSAQAGQQDDVAATGFGEMPQAAFTHAPDVPRNSLVDWPIADRIARIEAIRAKTREVERIKARLAREKQFNKRVAINAELRAAKLELERLTGATAQPAATSE
ncbi:DUF4391 domain-containing protein [Thalassobaculum sp. OXR-137]|uniref:DUF4391 domain-containing protein n=1 Tax=Thalassobaculum sp. OXR-137 TaxID=3100173 RepID=UPI002AC90E9F|nr:DUF4391 domain-containing protein [Thalassobaculum sp. OXR-137]WPZ35818.1 DUF4391 domain-containing protein [Thalassobaculum sp. OXR-137]